jgi:hypothetical protein
MLPHIPPSGYERSLYSRIVVEYAATEKWHFHSVAEITGPARRHGPKPRFRSASVILADFSRLRLQIGCRRAQASSASLPRARPQSAGEFASNSTRLPVVGAKSRLSTPPRKRVIARARLLIPPRPRTRNNENRVRGAETRAEYGSVVGHGAGELDEHRDDSVEQALALFMGLGGYQLPSRTDVEHGCGLDRRSDGHG